MLCIARHIVRHTVVLHASQGHRFCKRVRNITYTPHCPDPRPVLVLSGPSPLGLNDVVEAELALQDVEQVHVRAADAKLVGSVLDVGSSSDGRNDAFLPEK